MCMSGEERGGTFPKVALDGKISRSGTATYIKNLSVNSLFRSKKPLYGEYQI